MNITINEQRFDKGDLLTLINENQLQAIAFLRSNANIGLKDAKQIVDNLAADPDYYNGQTIHVAEREEEHSTDVKSTPKNQPPETSKTTANKSHITIPYVVALELVSVLLYFLFRV